MPKPVIKGDARGKEGGKAPKGSSGEKSPATVKKGGARKGTLFKESCPRGRRKKKKEKEIKKTVCLRKKNLTRMQKGAFTQ